MEYFNDIFALTSSLIDFITLQNGLDELYLILSLYFPFQMKPFTK